MRVPRPPANAVLALAMLAFVAAWLSATASQEKKKQEPAKSKQTETKKEEPKQPEAKKEEPPKEDAALFTSFRKASGRGEQTKATASAGAKGAKPFGKQASGPPSSTARVKLLDMEEIKPKADEMSAFVKEGGLKGGSQ